MDEMVEHPPGTHYDPHHGQHGPKWQRHVMVFLWVALAAAILVIAGLLYANAHGYFQRAGSRNEPVPHAWPSESP